MISLRICTVLYFEFEYFIKLSWKMPKNSLFKFMSRKFAKTAKLDDAPTYRKYFVPDFSFLEGFDNMSVILDAGPAELPNVETVEEAIDVPQLEPGASEPMNVESDTAETAAVAPEAMETAPVESEAVEPMNMEPDTTERATLEPDTAEPATLKPQAMEMATVEPQAKETPTVEPQAIALAPTEPVVTKTAATRMNPENWAR